jgi:Leucine-rich repeat (LRR) protein
MTRFIQTLSILPVFVLVLIVGCEDSPVWQDISGEKPDQTTVPTSRSKSDIPVIKSSERSGVTNSETSVISSFLALRPGEITDGHLAQLTSLKEGLEQITQLDIETSQVTVSGLKQIGNLKWLNSLNLSRRQLTDDILMQLKEIQDLQILTLNNCSLQDDQLSHLEPLVSLRELSLGNNSLTDKAFEHFKYLVNLELLDVSRARSDGSGFKVFEKIKPLRLKSIIAHFTGFGKAGPGIVGDWDQLEVLQISRCNLDDTGLGKLSRLENLRELDVSFNAITDRGVKKIDRLPNVASLKLIENKGVSNASLEAIKEWKSLRTLEIDQTSCNLGGVQELKKYLPQATIQFQGQKY